MWFDLRSYKFARFISVRLSAYFRSKVWHRDSSYTYRVASCVTTLNASVRPISKFVCTILHLAAPLSGYGRNRVCKTPTPLTSLIVRDYGDSYVPETNRLFRMSWRRSKTSEPEVDLRLLPAEDIFNIRQIPLSPYSELNDDVYRDPGKSVTPIEGIHFSTFY